MQPLMELQKWLLSVNLIAILMLIFIQTSGEPVLGIEKIESAIKKVWKFVNYLVKSCIVRQNLLS